MKFKPSFAFDELSGKAGSVVAVNTKKNPFLRPRITPTNPQSAAQMAQRGFISDSSVVWGTLSDSQRAAWEAATPDWMNTAMFAGKRKPSGFNLFMQLNANLDEVAAANITSPLAKVAIAGSSSVGGAAADGANTFTVSFAPTPVAASTALIVRATRQLGAGRKPSKSDYRNLVVLPAGTATGASIHAAYIAKFGAILAGKKVGLEFIVVSVVTGQKELPARAIVTIAA